MSRFKGFDTGRKRGSAYGRLYSVAGGAPNHPLVAFAASAGWLRVGNSGFLTPQALTFERGFSKVGDAQRLKEWIDDDLKTWRAEPNRANKPILIAVETSQAPNLYMALAEMFRADESEAALDVLTVGYRLRRGDQNVMERMGEMQSGAYDVGGNWPVSDEWVAQKLPDCADSAPMMTPCTARSYPRAVPGRLTSLVAEPCGGGVTVTGRTPSPSTAELWFAGERPQPPTVSGTGLGESAVEPRPGGYRVTVAVSGDYRIQLT